MQKNDKQVVQIHPLAAFYPLFLCLLKRLVMDKVEANCFILQPKLSNRIRKTLVKHLCHITLQILLKTADKPIYFSVEATEAFLVEKFDL